MFVSFDCSGFYFTLKKFRHFYLPLSYGVKHPLLVIDSVILGEI